jgi:hypothetical protein
MTLRQIGQLVLMSALWGAVFMPEEASIGETPQMLAKDASLFNLLGLSPTAPTLNLSRYPLEPSSRLWVGDDQPTCRTVRVVASSSKRKRTLGTAQSRSRSGLEPRIVLRPLRCHRFGDVLTAGLWRPGSGRGEPRSLRRYPSTLS